MAVDAGRVEADDAVVGVERREAHPAARARVAGVEPAAEGEEEDAGAGAADQHWPAAEGEGNDRPGHAVAGVGGADAPAGGFGVREHEERHGPPAAVAVVVAAEGLRAGDSAPQPADPAAAGDLLGQQAEEGQVEGVDASSVRRRVAATSVRRRVAASSVRRRVAASSVRLHGGRVGLGWGAKAVTPDRETRKTEMGFNRFDLGIWRFREAT
jgi:hypothetical protein